MIATTMALVAVAFVLPPLLRRHDMDRVIAPDELNTEVARERLAELEQDLEAGRLDQAQYDTARADLERELLNDLTPTGPATTRPVRSGRWAAVLIALAIPVGATLLYRALGSEAIIPMLNEQPAAAPGQAGATPNMSVEEMVARLAQRMEQQPDDLRGWVMLAKSYSVLERFNDALPAYRNIMRLGGGNDASILADYADALAATENGKFSDEAGKLLTTALQLDPENLKALWLAGHWKNQKGDTAAAIADWEHAARLLPADGEDIQVIRHQIQQARAEAGMPPLAEPVAAATASTQQAVPAAPPAAASGASLQVAVSLDPALQDRVSATDTVFIYARAATGPRMPLAIVRKQVSDLPLTVTLDDSMSMAPGMVMSAFPELTVGARVSKSGNAMPQSGDLQGAQSPVRLSDTHSLSITIDSAVP